VDAMLTKILREHQREGLQFLFDCVTGQKKFAGQGWCAPSPKSFHLSTNTCELDHWANCTMIVRCCCSILADDMGLGKTLQGVALIWTLLTSGHEALGGVPVCKRAMIVCPTSLVDNWNGEFKRWLQARSCYDAYRYAISATLMHRSNRGKTTMKYDFHVRAQHSCTTSPFRFVYPSAR
jgi:DNA repair and recombination protein RAD54 and RAD54-like protein